MKKINVGCLINSCVVSMLSTLFCAGVVSAQGMVCQQSLADATKLNCAHQQSTTAVVAETATGQQLKVVSNTAYPSEGQSTAILYLVDTSNPHRQPVVKKNGELIHTLVSHALAYHKSGIAVFDSDFRMVVPIGSDASVLNDAAAQLKAKGSTTEFYRNIISAVKQLGKQSTSRKVLVVFSDGLAEDEAYSHEDVIAAAKQAHVEIVGLGYAASVLKATALQRLRRLADETSGLYKAAASDLNFPSDFSEIFYHHIDQGGEVVIDLAPLSGEQDVEIRFMKGEELLSKYSQHVILPEKANPKRMLYIIAVAVVLLILIVMFLIRRKRLIAEREKALEDALPTVLAQLEILGREGAWVDMSKPVWRIGRNDGNDLQLDDLSITGFHAEIHQNRDGDFSITDLDSTNGVLVNDVEKHSHLICDGDVIELGDIRLRFHCDGDIIESGDRQQRPIYYDNEELEETNMYRGDS